MRNIIIVFFAFLCCNFSIGQETIEDIDYFENGQVRFKKKYKLGDEITDLTVEAYYSNGKLASKSIISFDGNRTKYDYTKYFESGKIYTSGKGHDNIYDNENNKITEYVNNEFAQLEYDSPSPEFKDGRWIEYYENGQLKYDADFEEGKEVGEWITYFENGQIKSKGVYEAGEKKGEWITYFENGKIESKKYYQ